MFRFGHLHCARSIPRRSGWARTAAAASFWLAACTSDGDDGRLGVDAGSLTARDSGEGDAPDGFVGSAQNDAASGAQNDAASVPSDAAIMAQGDSGSSLPTKKCVVFLHGKSGSGFATENRASYTMVGPTGNADGWGGKQWIYFPDAQLEQVRRIVAEAITANACTQVVVHGFSNGAAAAGKLYCRGNTFEGRVVGYIVDDPVPDHGADGCSPAASTKVRLYWTGGLTPTDGWNCADGDWTCEGGTTVGIAKYSANLRTEQVQSASTQHTPYTDPPEYTGWL